MLQDGIAKSPYSVGLHQVYAAVQRDSGNVDSARELFEQAVKYVYGVATKEGEGNAVGSEGEEEFLSSMKKRGQM